MKWSQRMTETLLFSMQKQGDQFLQQTELNENKGSKNYTRSKTRKRLYSLPKGSSIIVKTTDEKMKGELQQERDSDNMIKQKYRVVSFFIKSIVQSSN